MAKKTRKQQRKELLQEEDAFINAASDGAHWATEHKSLVIGALVVLLVVITGVSWQGQHKRDSDMEASGLFQAGLKVMNAEIIEKAEPILDPDGNPDPDAEFAVADPSDDPPTFESDKAKFEAALAKFQIAATDSGSSQVSNLAKFYIGDLQVRLEQHDAALATFQGLSKSLKPGDSLYFIAAERSAYLLEQKGDVDSAIKALAPMQSKPGLFFADYAAFHKGRMLQSKGDAEAARSAFEGIENNHPESSLKSEIEGRLNEIGRSPEVASATDAKKSDAKAVDKAQ